MASSLPFGSQKRETPGPKGQGNCVRPVNAKSERAVVRQAIYVDEEESVPRMRSPSLPVLPG